MNDQIPFMISTYTTEIYKLLSGLRSPVSEAEVAVGRVSVFIQKRL